MTRLSNQDKIQAHNETKHNKTTFKIYFIILLWFPSDAGIFSIFWVIGGQTTSILIIEDVLLSKI